MEININKDIFKYKEKMFFGLDLRQLICSGLGIGAAVLVYFKFKDIIGQETLTYICMFSAFPFALFGFLSYHRMPFEKVLVLWFKDRFLTPSRLVRKPKNYYYEAIQIGKESKGKELLRVKNSRNNNKRK